MTPFHFGQSGRALYGVYHAGSAASRAPAVLLCNPFGEEAIRAFRIFRLLADRLAGAGSPVLRFDYYGTGDSAGLCTEVTADSLCGDIQTAHRELKDMAGASRVIWLGLRLGAGLAAEAAVRGPERPAGLILWDPVVEGTAYLQDLARAHDKTLAYFFDRPETPENALADTGPLTEAIGFELGPDFAPSLAPIDLRSLAAKPARKALVIAGHDPQTDRALEASLNDAGTGVRWEVEQDDMSWNSDQAMNAFVVPAKTVETIVEAVATWR
ncbi:MAG: alpha/beta hydrolase [Pseudomonadota bacterium]